MAQPSREGDHYHGESYVASITGDRQAKDAYFRTAAGSPLRRPGVEVRALSYFRSTNATGSSCRRSAARLRTTGRPP
ncbi:MAG TPA: hypothetical protein VGQ02_00285 [Candidatus Limnocylindrales bacterium]|nr:hypothetical protein [Candidatus Limnocylindrales bacterium]